MNRRMIHTNLINIFPHLNFFVSLLSKLSKSLRPSSPSFTASLLLYVLASGRKKSVCEESLLIEKLYVLIYFFRFSSSLLNSFWIFSLFLRILIFSVRSYEFFPMLDFTVVFNEDAYLSDEVISSFLEGDFIHTDFLRSSMRCIVLYIPCKGPMDL